MSDAEMNLSRRNLMLGAAGAAAATALPASAIPSEWRWPHPDVGRVPQWSEPFDGAACPMNSALVGIIVVGGRVIDPGRVYTIEEWERVKGDVSPWVKRRNEALWPSLG